MRLIDRYVTGAFLVAFFMAIGLLTFAMTGANLLRVLDFVSQGIPASIFFKYMFYLLPRILTFTVPWAVLVAVMLVFGRMSADNEITAMRACGISILQIVSPILVITALLTAICIYLQTEVGPPMQGKSRTLIKQGAISQPLSLFEPGKPVSFSEGATDTVISIDDKNGTNGLIGVLFCRTDSTGRIEQEIISDTGHLSANHETQMLTITLFDCMVTNHLEKDGSIDRFFAKELKFHFNYGKEANAERISIKSKHMRLGDLLAEIRRYKKLNIDSTGLEIELNQRIAFALSPIAFLLLGLPLAIRTSRRETSIGMFISVILAGAYFMAITMCESLDNFPKLYPQYLLWIPNIAFQLLGAVLTYRISQR